MINVPKIFEGAIASVVKAAGNFELPRIRTWQNISAETKWTPTNDRVFPVIDIRATPAVTAEDGCAQRVNVSLLVATNGNEDKDHSDISRWFELVSGVLDSLYSQFRSGTAGAERNTFDAYVAAQTAGLAPTLSIGGFEHGDPMTPYEDSGAYFIGLNFVIHFSRSDY